MYNNTLVGKNKNIVDVAKSISFYIFQPNHGENLLQLLHKYHTNIIWIKTLYLRTYDITIQ
jgi:hypothetical protein